MSNRIITSWSVESGNLYEFGSTLFDDARVRKINSEGREAIRLLCEKILETEKGSVLATAAYQPNKRLITAVAFSEEKGLRLKLNGVEHQIASADEVYRGLVPGLKEIKKIHAIAERQGFINVEPTEEIANRVFQDVMTKRAFELEAPTLVNRTGVLKGDETSCLQKIGKIAVLWKAILFITGLEVMKSAFDNMVAALTNQNNWEKFFLSCANFLEGLATLGTAVIYLMKEISTFTQNLVTKAAAGAAFPVTAFIFYGSILAAAIYRLYVQLKFRYELNAIVGDGNDPKKLKEALIWLKQQTQLSRLEMKESTDCGIFGTLQRKWEAFTLRVEEGMIDEIITPENLDDIIENFDVDSSRCFITMVQKANSRAMLWTVGSILMNAIGLVATGAYIGAFGHIHTGVVTALYVIAAIGSLLTDSPKLRLKFFRWLRENCDWIESRDVSIVGSDCETNSVTSSISYDPNAVLPQTPLRLTAETLRLSQAS